MGRIIPGIPYKSQSDSDASDFRNDCGPACVAMILNGLGINVSTNTVYRRTGAGANEYVSVSQMMNAAATYDVDFDYFYPWDLEDIKNAVRQGKAVIPLVHYGEWSKLGKTQSSFTGPHFVVVVGYDENYIYVNDPLWWGDRRSEGEHKRWTHSEFTAAWSNAHKDGNRDHSGIYCTHALPTQSIGSVIEPDPIEEPETEPTPEPEPEPTLMVDPTLKRRIYAWSSFHGIPIPELTSQAVVTAYSDAMGTWGLNVVTHTVTNTDTLPMIALKYYDDPLKWEALVYFNGMTFADPIYEGDLLLVPEPNPEPVEIPEADVPVGGQYGDPRDSLPEMR